MLEIRLKDAGKRFQYEWIFKNLNLQVKPFSKTAITGSNGSGKSTFLKCLAGAIPLTDGTIEYSTEGHRLSEGDFYKSIAISAPYMELPEEFTLKEILQFHFQFKSPISGMNIQDMVKTMYLSESIDKQVTYFSSGMKQRLKLGLCFFSDVPMLILDEPTSNLDTKGGSWYQELVSEFGYNRTIVVGSNDAKEYSFCTEELNIEDYKLKSVL
ncbi:heme ABC exporter ATP-binding protein CcmA [Echinicola sediminis]